jgi:hypothetical protein
LLVACFAWAMMIGMDSPRRGWVRVEGLSEEELHGRRARLEALIADQDEQHARAHRETFGHVTVATVLRTVMPLSGWIFEWRGDGYSRAYAPDDTDDASDDDNWSPWVGDDAGYSSAAELEPGDSPEATWWLHWGEVHEHDRVACWLADDRDVPDFYWERSRPTQSRVISDPEERVSAMPVA